MTTISHVRHISKAISWRIIGTLDTMLIGWLVTGSIEMGALIGGIEVITKTFLYYAHERVWYSYIPLGVRKHEDR
jgi:uncharacterized membrane protein